MHERVEVLAWKYETTEKEADYEELKEEIKNLGIVLNSRKFVAEVALTELINKIHDVLKGDREVTMNLADWQDLDNTARLRNL